MLSKLTLIFYIRLGVTVLYIKVGHPVALLINKYVNNSRHN